jgi:hypothetical protein
MVKHTAYLVCHEHINDVKKFLAQFFEQEITKYNHENWITFVIPPGFKLNLMKGLKQKLTQNFMLELGCDTKKELEEFANKYGQEIKHFTVTEVTPNYEFYYIEIPGPHDICRMDVSYCGE